MNFKTRPLHEGFGVEALNTDLNQIDETLAQTILSSLIEHGLLLFRRQSLHDEDILNLSLTLGKVEIPANRKAHSPNFEQLLYISNLQDADGQLIGSETSNTTGGWHSDQAFRSHPATLSTLFCVVAPERGGSTRFCSTKLGYDALPEALKQRMEGVRGKYLPGRSHEIEKIEVTHPAILVNPTNGRKTLYIGPNTRGFMGIEENSGKILLDELLSYLLRPEHIYQHNWRMGDMVIYDNAQLLHRRDAFKGYRWLKATRVFLSPEHFSVPD